MSKVVLLPNKWWEAVALVSVLEHARDIKPEFSAAPAPFDVISRVPPREHTPKKPRLECRINEVEVDVLCVEDLIPQDKDSSSSAEKQSVLKSLASEGYFDDAIIIAFGTAASPEANCAGNVIVGSSVFVFDASPHSESADSAIFEDRLGEIVDSEAGELLIDKSVIALDLAEAQKRFLSGPQNPSPKPRIYAGANFVSVGVINMHNNQEYQHIDALALDSFVKAKKEQQETQSIETTHGLIRLCIERPYLYVSGIANQVGRFGNEVAGNKYSQNYAACHNAAVCIAWMLPRVCASFGKQERH